jgi:hypothetical protein
MAKIIWKNKRCPKCGSAVDRFETCRECGRAWSEILKDGESAVDANGKPLEDGKQHEAIVYPVVKPKRESRYTKSKRQEPFSDQLPERFKEWTINKHDGEAEIYRKRSLMRLDSRKIYNQMGLSVRAHENHKATLLWLTGLMEFLDDQERKELAPIVERLKICFDVMGMVRRSKIAQAAQMEKLMEKMYADSRRARITAEAKKKATVTSPEKDSEGLGLEPVALDPAQLLEQAKEKLLALDKAKNQQRRKPKEENPFEE